MPEDLWLFEVIPDSFVGICLENGKSGGRDRFRLTCLLGAGFSWEEKEDDQKKKMK